MRFIEALGAVNVLWYITAAVILVMLAVWTAYRYKSVGVVGFAAIAVLPFSLLSWDRWDQFIGNWAIGVTAAVVVAAFVTGMLVSKKIDDLFHWVAMGSVLALPVILGLLTTMIPMPVVVPIVTLVAGVWAVIKRPWRKTEEAAPATSS